jgi:hypothetical protein
MATNINLESDQNKTIVRLILESDFRDSMRTNMDKTISDAGYVLTPEFVQSLKTIDFSRIAGSTITDVATTLQDLQYVKCW